MFRRMHLREHKTNSEGFSVCKSRFESAQTRIRNSKVGWFGFICQGLWCWDLIKWRYIDAEVLKAKKNTFCNVPVIQDCPQIINS